MNHGSAHVRPSNVPASIADGKCAARSSARTDARQVEEPSRARELGHPDAVEHHHVEAGPAALEVDDEELPLLVGAPEQRLGLDPDAGMRAPRTRR